MADRLLAAAEELEARYADGLLGDENTDGEFRTWLHGSDPPLWWAPLTTSLQMRE